MVDLDLNRVIEGIIFEIILGDMEDNIAKDSIEMTIIGCDDYNRGRERSGESSFSGNYSSNRTRSTSNSRLRSGSRASPNRDRIRCYNFREYDYFTRDCPTSREERDLDQLQQMLNLEEEETLLLHSRQSSPIENSISSPLNL